MGKLFENKYRIESARLKGWDYGSEGAYFITICTKDRAHFFGECVNGKMKLSTMGAIVQGCWYDIPAHFPHIALGAFVTMPNHIHGILVLNKSLQEQNRGGNDDDNDPTFYQAISPDAGSIPTVIRSFKSACTKHIRETFPKQNFGWQERFWDKFFDQ